MRRSSLLITLIVIASPLLLFGQFTTTTAFIHDANGSPYANCAYTAIFVGQNTVPGHADYTLAGATTGQFQRQVGGQCTSAATFSVLLADNNQVFPTPSQWRFNICDMSGKFCFNSTCTVTGSTLDVSTCINANAVILPAGSGGGGGFIVTFTTQTTVVVPGTTHNLKTRGLDVVCYDNAMPANNFQPGAWTVNGATFDVTISFASPKTGYCVLLAGGSGSGGSSLQPITTVIITTTSPGTDICSKINNAIKANTSGVSSQVIDTRLFLGSQPCASNPYAGVAADSTILFADGVLIQTTVPWITPSSYDAYIIGGGRGSNNRGTTIQAVAGFPTTCDSLASGCPILRLGDGTGPAFGQRLSDATLDCNGQVGCIGIYSTDIQEQTGARHFQVINYSNIGVLIDGSSNAGAGPFWAQNYIFYDGEIYALAFGNSSTIGMKLIGGNNVAGGETAPRLIEGITASGSSGNLIGTAFQMEQFWGGQLIGLNAEFSTTGYQFGIAQPMNGTTGTNLRCASVTTNCVWITSNSPFSNNIVLTGIQNTPTVAIRTIKDDLLSQNISDATVGMYAVGNGYTTGGLTNITTSSTAKPSTLTGLNLNTGADTEQTLTLNSGKTVQKGDVIQFQDRGITKWNIEYPTNGSTILKIFDNTANFDKLRFNNTSGQSFMNSNGTSAILFNNDVGSGTGGITVCNGGTTCNFIVNGLGNTTVNRLFATAGTHYAGADSAIVPSAGWGTTPTVSAGGVDQGFRFGISAGGTGIGANPTVVITFKDGAWPTIPTYVCGRSDLNTPWNSPPFTWTDNVTTLTITFNGTPTSGLFYSFFCVTAGAGP